MTIDEIVAKLLAAKEAYYNGEPIMTDPEFDALEEELYSLDPDNYYFSIVGTNIKGSAKVKHEEPMLSCGKGKSIKDIMVWVNKIFTYVIELIIMPKIDGLSASIKYRSGNIFITTRGNGKIGQDVSFLKDYLNIPSTIPVDGEVRGEIYLPKDTFFNTEGKPLRNAAAGLVNRKDDREDCKYLHFVAYQFIPATKTMDKILIDLIAWGFDVVDFEIATNNEYLEPSLTSFYNKYINEYRNAWKYETDGLVLQINDTACYEKVDSLWTVSHHHHYNIAWKPEAEGAETILRRIIWDVSRTGRIVPVAEFDPIVLGNRTITKATLNNYEWVKDNNLKIGDAIFITLNNDVIPALHHVVKHNNGQDAMPDVCPSCGQQLYIDGVDLVCANKSCRDKNIKILTEWTKDCEMDGVSEATITALYDNNFVKEVSDFYQLYRSKDTLINLDGFGESKIANLLDQIERSKKMNVQQFIGRLSIGLVGVKAVKKLGILSLDDFWAFSDKSYVIGKNLICYRNENESEIKKLLKYLNISDLIEKQSIGKICMTGTGPKGRKELTAEAEAKGYCVVDSVNKELNILICDDVNGSSSKIVKAKKLGIKVMTYGEFFV